MLDPACGSGAFLIAAFDYLLNEGALVNSEITNLRGGQQELFRWDTHILRNNLYGVDINTESVEITKLSLWLKTANPREALTYLDDKIRVGNSVVPMQALAADAFDWGEFGEERFDVVVTNPPYVSMLELSRLIREDVRRFWKQNYQAATGAYDLYVLFMEQAIRQVREDGYIGLITPNKYIAAPYGVGIRNVIRENVEFCGVLDVSRDRVFQDPSVYPLVSIFKKTGNNNGPTSYVKRDAATGRVGVVRSLPAKSLDALPERMFSLLTSEYANELSAVLEFCIRLEDVAEVNATSTAAEADMLSGHIIEHTTGATPLVNTGTIDRYLALWGVSPLRDKGRTYMRPAIRLGGVELSVHRRHIYESPKIIFAKMALRPEAFLDGSGEYCSINTNCVYDADVPLEYLTGVLNSKALAFIYDQFFGALRMSGGYLQFQSPQLRALPVPNADRAAIEAIRERVANLHAHVERLLSAKRDFIRLLVADLAMQGVSKKLGRFESLTWKSFASEIERQGVALAGRFREDWHARFAERSLEIKQLQEIITADDAAVDDLVWQAYGLTRELREKVQNALGDGEGDGDNLSWPHDFGQDPRLG